MLPSQCRQWHALVQERTNEVKPFQRGGACRVRQIREDFCHRRPFQRVGLRARKRCQSGQHEAARKGSFSCPSSRQRISDCLSPET